MNKKRRNWQRGFGCYPAPTNEEIVDPFAGGGGFLVPYNNLTGRKIDITRLRKFAADLPDSPLKDALLTEVANEVDAQVFLARLPIWLRLAKSNRR